MITGFWVVLTGQVAAETLVVGGALRQLHPGALAVAAFVVAAAEIAGCYRFARAPAGIAARHVGQVLRHGLGRLRRHPLLLVLGVLVVAQYSWQIVLSVRLPPVAYDALSYHLIGPATWIQHGAIVHSRQDLFSDVYPADQELLTAWVGTFFHSLRYAGLTTLAFVAMAASAVTMLARALKVRSSLALLGGLGIIAMPAVFLQASTAYVDIAGGATVLAALGFLLIVTSSVTFDGGTARGLAGHLLLAGTAAGLAAGTKSNNVVIAVIVMVMAFVQYVRVTDIRPGQSERTVRPRGRVGVACVALPIAALSAFWYIRTWVTWSNPFYPATVLGFPGLGSTNRIIIGANPPAQIRHAPLGELGAIVTSWLYDLHRHAYTYDQRLGGFGLQWPVIIVPALVIATIWFARHRPGFALGLVLPVVLVALASTAAWWARYTVALAGVGCVCLAHGLERLARRAEKSEAAKSENEKAQKDKEKTPPIVGRATSPRRKASTVAAVSTLFVAATGLSMWWASNPTDYLVLGDGSVHTASVAQLRHVMDLHDPGSVLSPWFAYTQLDQFVPLDAPLAIVAHDQTFTYPLIGPDLTRRLIQAGSPTTAGQLATVLRRSGVLYVLLGPAARASPLAASVAADPASFLPLTSGGPINGSDVYQLGHWPTCTNATMTLLDSSENSSGVFSITGKVLDSCGPVAGASVELFQGDARIPIWQGSDVIIATGTTAANGNVDFTVAHVPARSRYFLRSNAQQTGRTFHGATASGVVTPEPAAAPP